MFAEVGKVSMNDVGDGPCVNIMIEKWKRFAGLRNVTMY